ncbi:MAG: NADPH-dependent FMN reductase [Thalassotalea sp.]
MNILAFAASNNSQSINKQLVTYAASTVAQANVEVIDINDYELPIFSQDREAELGQPALAQAFYQKLGQADAIIVSFAEHNGTYTAAYKNLFDWVSRIERNIFQGKSVVYLATSPGPGGAKNVLASAVDSAPFFGAELKGSLSVPSFNDNFDTEKQCLSNQALDNELRQLVSLL